MAFLTGESLMPVASFSWALILESNFEICLSSEELNLAISDSTPLVWAFKILFSSASSLARWSLAWRT